MRSALDPKIMSLPMQKKTKSKKTTTTKEPGRNTLKIVHVHANCKNTVLQRNDRGLANVCFATHI